VNAGNSRVLLLLLLNIQTKINEQKRNTKHKLRQTSFMTPTKFGIKGYKNIKTNKDKHRQNQINKEKTQKIQT
jgi:hypothetical protein